MKAAAAAGASSSAEVDLLASLPAVRVQCSLHCVHLWAAARRAPRRPPPGMTSRRAGRPADAQEYFTPPGSFDAVQHMLECLPDDVDEAFIGRQAAQTARVLEAVSAKLSARVMRSYGAFVHGMAQVQQLKSDLTLTAIQVRGGGMRGRRGSSRGVQSPLKHGGRTVAGVGGIPCLDLSFPRAAPRGCLGVLGATGLWRSRWWEADCSRRGRSQGPISFSF